MHELCEIVMMFLMCRARSMGKLYQQGCGVCEGISKKKMDDQNKKEREFPALFLWHLSSAVRAAFSVRAVSAIRATFSVRAMFAVRTTFAFGTTFCIVATFAVRTTFCIRAAFAFGAMFAFRSAFSVRAMFCGRWMISVRSRASRRSGESGGGEQASDQNSKQFFHFQFP